MPLLSAGRKQILRNIRDGVAGAIAAPFAVIVQLLPRRVRLYVRAMTGVTGQLDYRGANLRLRIDSSTEMWRTASCSKEPGTVKWLDEALKPGDIFYDIGANIGAYTLIAATKVGPDGRVVSFEPSFRNYGRLNDNLEANALSGRVMTIPLALSNKPGVARFHFSSRDIGAASHWMEDVSQREGARPSVATQHVMVDRLDEIVARYKLPPPTVLKLDVDGPEFEVLQGCGDLIDLPSLRSLLVEMEPSPQVRARIADFLGGHGWVVQSRNRHKGNSVDEDWIWVRRS